MDSSLGLSWSVDVVSEKGHLLFRKLGHSDGANRRKRGSGRRASAVARAPPSPPTSTCSPKRRQATHNNSCSHSHNQIPSDIRVSVSTRFQKRSAFTLGPFHSPFPRRVGGSEPKAEGSCAQLQRTAVRCHRRERVERRVCRPAGLAQCRRGVSLQRGEGGGSSARCRRGRERHTDRQRQRVSAAPAADWQRQ